MPELPVDASKFAGMSEEQARSFPRRTVVGEDLTNDQLAAIPKMVSTDSHVMEPDELWRELPTRLQEHLPKVPFRNSPPRRHRPASAPARPGHRWRRRRNPVPELRHGAVWHG